MPGGHTPRLGGALTTRELPCAMKLSTTCAQAVRWAWLLLPGSRAEQGPLHLAVIKLDAVRGASYASKHHAIDGRAGAILCVVKVEGE